MILSFTAAHYVNAVFQPSSMKCPSCDIGGELRFFPCFFDPQKDLRGTTPPKFNMEPEMMVSKRNHLFQGLLFRFHVKFQGN